jgi:hypothetical protein
MRPLTTKPRIVGPALASDQAVAREEFGEHVGPAPSFSAAGFGLKVRGKSGHRPFAIMA